MKVWVVQNFLQFRLTIMTNLVRKESATYEASNSNGGIVGISNPSKVRILMVVERRWSLILTTKENLLVSMVFRWYSIDLSRAPWA